MFLIERDLPDWRCMMPAPAVAFVSSSTTAAATPTWCASAD
jgi:hypothetical protein